MFLSILLLGACADSSVKADLSDYPVSVQNGNISVEYYYEILRFYDEYMSYLDATNMLLKTYKDHPNVAEDGEYADLVETTVKSYNASLSSFTTEPKTKSEEEIEFELDKVIHLQTAFNNTLKEQFDNEKGFKDTELFVRLSIINNVFDDLSNTVEEYGLLD